MAGSYIVVAQNPDVQVLGPTQVLDVERVGFRTIPSGVYAEYPIDRASWGADRGAQLLGALASTIEGLIGEGLATTATYANDLDEAGLLVDYLDFVVEYVPPNGTAGTMTGIARVSMGSLIGDSDPFLFNIAGNPREVLLATYDKLRATAAY